MKCCILLLLIFNLGIFFSTAQDSLSSDLDNTFAFQGTYAKSGIYAGFSGSGNLYKGWGMNVACGLNVRHFNYGEISPLIAIGLGYDVFRKHSQFTLSPGIKVQHISSRISDVNHVKHIEFLLGYELEYGKKYKLIQGAYYGFGRENSANLSVDYQSYLIHIGFGYAF